MTGRNPAISNSQSFQIVLLYTLSATAERIWCNSKKIIIPSFYQPHRFLEAFDEQYKVYKCQQNSLRQRKAYFEYPVNVRQRANPKIKSINCTSLVALSGNISKNRSKNLVKLVPTSVIFFT